MIAGELPESDDSIGEPPESDDPIGFWVEAASSSSSNMWMPKSFKPVLLTACLGLQWFSSILYVCVCV